MPAADDALLLSISREMRAEMRDHRTMLLQLVDASRRHERRFDELERRFGDLRGELELMLKGEMMGRISHFGAEIDEKLERLVDRLQTVEAQR
jgi:hypothetical protein